MILVVGGAGYIGSHFVAQAVKDYSVVILDNFSTGNLFAVHPAAICIHGDIADEVVLEELFKKYQITAVVHFAASSIVQESMQNPKKYYENNYYATFILLKMMLKHKISKLIFSSTAAVYGNANVEVIDENTPKLPIHPYGRTKLMIEWMIEDFSKTSELDFIILRYFNAAGAHDIESIGEHHEPETHLIPSVLGNLYKGNCEVSIFGNDFMTKDGSCIRDYVHVLDIANAHLLALQALDEGRLQAEIINIGSGTGHSVFEIIKKCEEVTGKRTIQSIVERREGDPAKLIASNEKAYELLQWTPTRSLTEIVTSAWLWELNKEQVLQSHVNLS